MGVNYGLNKVPSFRNDARYLDVCQYVCRLDAHTLTDMMITKENCWLLNNAY